MAQTPLLVPFLVDAAGPTASNGYLVPVTPTGIVSWPCEPGPSRRIAVAGQDKSIWVLSAPTPSSASSSRSKGKSRPTGIAVTSPSIPSIRSPTSPNQFRPHRPPAPRNNSYSGRPRAGSSTSSVLSTTSKRRVSAFSPPPSARQLPVTTLSSASASAAPPDSHTHRASLSDRAELREQLREQRERPREDNVGLGIAGIGRRGLTGVHGKEENQEHAGSGAVTPLSTASAPTENQSGGGGMFGFWRNSTSLDTDRELREQIEEVEVEREMEKESREGKKEQEDIKMVEEMAAIRSPSPSIAIAEEYDQAAELSSSAERKQVPVRLILPKTGKGTIVSLKAFSELNALCVLRDEGILDVFSLDTLKHTAFVDLEQPEEATPSSSRTQLRLSPSWLWKGIHLARKDQTYLLVVHGIPWPCAMPSPNGEVTRVIVLDFNLEGKFGVAARLELPGEGDIGLCRDGDATYLLHATPTSLTSYPIVFPVSATTQQVATQPRASPQVRAVSSAFTSPLLRSATPSPPNADSMERPGIRKSASHSHLRDAATAQLHQNGLGNGHISVLSDRSEKGFAKFLAARKADWAGRKGEKEDRGEAEVNAGIGEGKEVERDGYGHWKGIFLHESGEGVGFAEDAVDMFFCDGKKLKIRGTISLANAAVREVIFTAGWEQVIISTTAGETMLYRMTQGGGRGGSLSFEQTRSLPHARSITFDSPNHLLLAHNDAIQLLHLEQMGQEPERLAALRPVDTSGGFSHVIPNDVENLFVADRQGNVHTRALATLISEASADSTEDDTCVDRLDSAVTCMDIISFAGGHNSRYIVAGDEDGALRIWTAEPFKLCGSWTLFADPVRSLATLDMSQAGVLQGTLLCISRDGAVGVISLKEMDDLFLIPASRAPLRRVFIGGADILLAYANGKTRMWNVETKEFRRSTGFDAADDMLQSGVWAEIDLDIQLQGSPLTSGLSSVPDNSELGRLLRLDLRELGKWLHGAKNNPRHSPLPVLRSLLSLFLTFGIDSTADDVCIDKLNITKPSKSVITGLAGDNESYNMIYAAGVDTWKVSPSMTGMRQLVIVALLRPFLDSPDHERWAAEVIAYCTTSLPQVIEPDSVFFAEYYMDTSTDVHQAARMLFAARMGRMSELDIESIVEAHQQELPTHQISSERFSDRAARALTLLGGIALHKYQSLPPIALRAIAESVQLYLQETKSPHIALAIELCSRGFSTWQLHVDPMDLLRRLFHLATNKEAPSTLSSLTSTTGASLAAQARLAVLSIANSNAPLFMSTLSMDIRDAKTVEGRTSIMKLCVFMARKKPAVLENGLPRIAEAVVKSLDPNVGKMRDDVWQAATVILNELVLAFSTIDFHSGTQRLAVGTHEGAVIMYDLKTASRLYVLEPHKSPVSAVTFSPDGRRLITVSLQEGSVTIWKVGSSLSGFFNVVAGGPPRQGAEKGEPFKRIDFTRVDDVPLDSTTALSDVQITWPGARQARVLIKETAMTFET